MTLLEIYHNISRIIQLSYKQYALIKLRAKIEGREEKIYWEYRKFGHLVHNYRNKKKETKEKPISQNKFEVIANRVIQYRVKEEVKVRK